MYDSVSICTELHSIPPKGFLLIGYDSSITLYASRITLAMNPCHVNRMKIRWKGIECLCNFSLSGPYVTWSRKQRPVK